MGLRGMFETVRYAVTPSSVAETARHVGAVAAIHFTRAGELIAEGAHHAGVIAQDLARHLTAAPSVAENIEHAVCTLGEDIRYEVSKAIIKMSH